MIVFQTRTVETSISTAMWWSRHVSVCTTTTRQPAVPPAHEWPTDSHNTGHSASPLSPGLRPLGGLTQCPEQALSPWAKHTDPQWRGQPRTWLWVNTDWTLMSAENTDWKTERLQRKEVKAQLVFGLWGDCQWAIRETEWFMEDGCEGHV